MDSNKLLIISGDMQERSALRRQLQIAHYDVILAENEEEGIHLCTLIQPDLILLDGPISQPGRFKVLDQLKSNPITRSIPVISLTTKKNGALIEGSLDTESPIHIGKPCKLEELQSCIRKVLMLKEERRRVLEQASQLKKELTLRVVRDLRFPLMVISGLAEKLNQQLASIDFHGRSRGIYPASKVPSVDVGYVQHIIRKAEDLIDLIEDWEYLLGSDPIMEDVDLVQVAKTAVGRFDEQIKKKKQRLTVKFPKDSRLIVRGESHHLYVALRHLVSNAHQFTPPGGIIRITAACIDDRVRITVADTGSGISPLQQRLILDQFAKDSSELIDRVKMRGRGLMIAESVAQQHKGGLGFESWPGLGSRFWIDLPLAYSNQKNRAVCTIHEGVTLDRMVAIIKKRTKI